MNGQCKILTACLAAVLALSACGPSAAQPDDSDEDLIARTLTKSLRLGSSSYCVTVPNSYVNGEVRDADRVEDVVAYYHSEETSLDFDVYQFSKEGCPDDLAEFVRMEAEERRGDEIVTDAVIGDIPVASYRSVEESDGEDFDVITYALESEDGDEYIEVTFWLDEEGADEQAAKIMNSLSVLRTTTLQLGTSVFCVDVPSNFEAGEVTAEDRAAYQAGYYRSEATLLDFDVYQIPKGDGDTLSAFMRAEAAERGADTVAEEEINGIPTASYRATEQYQDKDYSLLVYAFENNGEYVEIVFWLDGVTAEAEASAIIKTLQRDEGLLAEI